MQKGVLQTWIKAQGPAFVMPRLFLPHYIIIVTHVNIENIINKFEKATECMLMFTATHTSHQLRQAAGSVSIHGDCF